MSAESGASLGSTIGVANFSGELRGHGKGKRRRTMSDAEALPWSHFAWHVRHEQRRADRSKSPLTLLVLHRTGIDIEEGPQRLLDLVRCCVRDTDIVCQPDAHQVAILLPETDSGGAATLINKIASKAGDTQVQGRHATYPDSLFEYLVSEHADLSEASQDHTFAPPKKADSYGRRLISGIGSRVALAMLLPLMFLAAAAIKIAPH